MSKVFPYLSVVVMLMNTLPILPQVPIVTETDYLGNGEHLGGVTNGRLVQGLKYTLVKQFLKRTFQ